MGFQCAAGKEERQRLEGNGIALLKSSRGKNGISRLWVGRRGKRRMQSKGKERERSESWK